MSLWEKEAIVRRRPLNQEAEAVVCSKKNEEQVIECINKNPIRRGPRLLRKYASSVGQLGPLKCHIPSHLRAELSKKACQEIENIGQKSDINFDEATKICQIVGIQDEKRIKKCIIACLQAQDDKTINTQQFINYTTNIKSDGGYSLVKAEIPKIPLPPCCNNPACRVCLRRSCARGNTFTACQRELYTVYCGWMRLTGKIALKDVLAILHNYEIITDRDIVTRAFALVDAGAKGMLTFEEFFVVMNDLKAADLIARKRSDAYRLDTNCIVFETNNDDTTYISNGTGTTLSTYAIPMFTEEETAQLKHHFGAFDISGDGLLDMQELRKALHEMGHRVSDRWLAKAMEAAIEGKANLQCNTRHKTRRKSREIILQQAYKRTLNFSQFLSVMQRLKKMQTDARNTHMVSKSRSLVGTQALLSEAYELTSFDAVLPRGVTEIKLTGPDSTTVQATYMGLKGTPYAHYILRLNVQASPFYPLRAPIANFTRKVLHLNFEVAPNGTHLTQLLKCWDPATWNLHRLFASVYDLLLQPDPNLLPSDLNLGTQHDPRLADTNGILRLPLGFDLRSRPVSYTVLAELAFLFKNKYQDYLDLVTKFAAEQLETYVENDDYQEDDKFD